MLPEAFGFFYVCSQIEFSYGCILFGSSNARKSFDNDLSAGNTAVLFLMLYYYQKMRKKQPAVQSTALAPIGADPIGEFIKTMPRTATILGCKGSRSAGKQVIYVAYLENGTVHHAHCAFTEGRSVSADIEVFSLMQEGGAA